MTLDCFACGKELQPAATLADDDTGVVPPYGGIRFESNGNYGSTVSDPADGHEFMEINVCDPCLLARAQLGRVAYGRSSVQVQVSWETFGPQVHDH